MEQTDDSERGHFRFQVRDQMLMNSAFNVTKLRALWLDRNWISGEALGPGDAGDFDRGAWHVACHLVGASGVLQTTQGHFLWTEVSHDPTRDRYYASVSRSNDSGTVPLDSSEGRSLIDGSTLLGYVEGNSTGRTSIRHAIDSPAAFNLWRRQDFDRPVRSDLDGGKVWEHWCTLRDIRETSELAASVLTAYVSLTAALGDGFIAMVARGRHEYGHPAQLCAMMEAGLVSEPAGIMNTAPVAIPPEAASAFATADPVECARACAALDWTGAPKYFMYERRIDRWVGASDMATALKEFRARSSRS